MTAKNKSWKCVSLPSSQIFWASVQKAIFGSSKWKRAQDFERKFGPWKQARVMWFPCKLMDPPNCIPSSGNGIWNKDIWHPDTTFNTPGQCRWCAASSTTKEPKNICHKWSQATWAGKRQRQVHSTAKSDSENEWKWYTVCNASWFTKNLDGIIHSFYTTIIRAIVNQV